MAEARRLTKAAFLEWVNSRQTRAFLALLRADRDRMADQWARGVLMDQDSQVRTRLLGELSTLRWPDVAGIYAAIDGWAAEAAAQDAEPTDDEESDAQ